MKLYWFNKRCCVPECFNSSTEGEGCYKEYFDLPAEPQARNRWLKAVLCEDGENLKICEDHFKEYDIFRDKSNRKKLRINSIPSAKLPKHVCTHCLGTTNKTDPERYKLCQCEPATPISEQSQNAPSTKKRTRIKWTLEEKKILFKAVKKYGEVKMGNNNNFRINWVNVTNHCRTNGCFGNEKELKTVWQNLRTNATKVYRNEIFGSKLDRKVCRFLFGKPLKRSRAKLLSATSTNNADCKNQILSTDDEEEQEDELAKQQMITEYEETNGAIKEDGEESAVDVKMLEIEETHLVDNEQESDEYYSITDVERKFNITIRPKPPEIISLLSSEDEE